MLTIKILVFLFIYIKFSFETNTIVFTRGEYGYFCIKIPSILTTSQGTLLSFEEFPRYNIFKFDH
ncbi:unnamed protein product, partial [Rotaria sordida]